MTACRCAAHDCTYGSTSVRCNACGREWKLWVPEDADGEPNFAAARWYVDPVPVLGPAATARAQARRASRKAS